MGSPSTFSEECRGISPPSEEMALECFLCREDGSASTPLYRVCRCATYVHESCFHKLLDVATHEEHCAVCRAPYPVTRTTHMKLVLPSFDTIMFHLMYMLCCLGVLFSLDRQSSWGIIMLAFTAWYLFILFANYWFRGNISEDGDFGDCCHFREEESERTVRLEGIEAVY